MSVCPRCDMHRMRPVKVHNALSRTDNKSYICGPCGMDEALRNMKKQPLPPPNEWPVLDTPPDLQ